MSGSAAPKRRQYRACLPCRSKKAKCDLGDPDSPQSPPCKRCRRESRECIFVASDKPFARKAALPLGRSSPVQIAASTTAPTSSSSTSGSPVPPPPPPRSNSNTNPSHQPQASTSSAHLHHSSSHESTPHALPLDHDEDAMIAEDELEDELNGTSEGGRRDSSGGGPSSNRVTTVLYSSSLTNPADALRVLASASALHASSSSSIAVDGGKGKGRAKKTDAVMGEREEKRLWETWQPVRDGLIAGEEAKALFSLYKSQLHPLYPLIKDEIFETAYLPHLVGTEYFLLATCITISARYGDPSHPGSTDSVRRPTWGNLQKDRLSAIHTSMTNFLRHHLTFILDGSPFLRHISSVESLLLLTEWPWVTSAHPFLTNPIATTSTSSSPAKIGQSDKNEEEDGIEGILAASGQFDSLSWSLIGCAVRLAQELRLDDEARYTTDDSASEAGEGGLPGQASWMQLRSLQTWLFAYNQDRHCSVRLGRNAVIQTHMSSQWWERVCQIASDRFIARGFQDEWAEPMPQGFLASLIGTIQDRLYANREITRVSLKTGYWEGILRSLSMEWQHMRRNAESILCQGTIASTLLMIEMDYLRLYANTIALRALQARSQRRVKVNDIYSISATLLNLQEGPFVIESISAAEAILRSTVHTLHAQGLLRSSPFRIFQRVLFAATFLFKSLAVGVVEHGQRNVVQLLDQSITALEEASIDQQHICGGFAAMLRRLQMQYDAPGRGNGGVEGEEHPDPSTATPQLPLPAANVQALPAYVPNSNEAMPAIPPALSPFSSSISTFPSHIPGSLPAGAPVMPVEEYSPFRSDVGPTPAYGVPPLPVPLQGLSNGVGDYTSPFQWLPDRNLLAVGEQQDQLFHSLWASDQYSASQSLIETLCGDNMDLGVLQF
ncbi:hypothetical protein T439DRAFT_328522 [Meredithblackwellia eburnea MCA 4105]